MAADPKPQPRNTPIPLQPARATMPMARRALREEARIKVYDDCWRCGGTGVVDRPYIECEDPRCGRIWTDDQVARHLGPAWRKNALPCGHRMPGGQPIFLHAQCQACGGSGELELTITLGQLLDWIESLYPESISAEITARREALRRF